MNAVVQSKCFEIESAIRQALLNGYPNYPGLAAGKAGIILFYTEMYEYTGEEVYLDKALSLLEEIINTYRFNESFYSHSSGAAGLMWLAGYLIRKDYIDSSVYEAFDELELPLYKKMLTLFDMGLYDYLHDGLSIYYAFSINDNLHINKEDLIADTIGQLEKIGTQDASGLGWYDIDFLNKKPVAGSYNFGLAHGSGSIISLLSQTFGITNSAHSRERIFKMVDSSISFLLSCRSQDPETLSLFPYITVTGQDTVYNSRLGWCYGDLGVAIAIRNAGKAFQHQQWLNTANEIVRISAARRDLSRNLIHDAGFCHGAAGLVHIYRSFYLESGDPVADEAARYWAEKTLALAVHKDGLAGYKTFSAEKGYYNTTGLLEGIAGTGLCLLSALREKKTDWDKVWLIF
jgi:lantibiotic modifying enzyme